MATMNISLPDQMRAWVEEQVAGGKYANASDYFRDRVRRHQEREAAVAQLRAEIDKARDDAAQAFRRGHRGH